MMSTVISTPSEQSTMMPLPTMIHTTEQSTMMPTLTLIPTPSEQSSVITMMPTVIPKPVNGKFYTRSIYMYYTLKKLTLVKLYILY